MKQFQKVFKKYRCYHLHDFIICGVIIVDEASNDDVKIPSSNKKFLYSIECFQD